MLTSVSVSQPSDFRTKLFTDRHVQQTILMHQNPTSPLSSWTYITCGCTTLLSGILLGGLGTTAALMTNRSPACNRMAVEPGVANYVYPTIGSKAKFTYLRTRNLKRTAHTIGRQSDTPEILAGIPWITCWIKLHMGSSVIELIPPKLLRPIATDFAGRARSHCSRSRGPGCLG